MRPLNSCLLNERIEGELDIEEQGQEFHKDMVCGKNE